MKAVVKKGWKCNWPPGATNQTAYNEGEVIDVTGHAEEAKNIEALQIVEEEQKPQLPNDNSDKVNYQELKAKAKELGIEGYNGMKKEELADAVEKALAVSEAETSS